MKYPIPPYQPKEPNYKRTVTIETREVYIGTDLDISDIPEGTESVNLSTPYGKNEDFIMLSFNKQVELEEHKKNCTTSM